MVVESIDSTHTPLLNGVDIIDLLHEASICFGDIERAPNEAWFRQYFTAFRISCILTDEGWEDIETLDVYRREDPDFEPLEILDFRADNS